MRAVFAALLALLVVPLVPGCLDDGPTFITAGDAQPAADRAARRWNDDATLRAVATEEPGEAALTQFEREVDEQQQELDRDRANGTVDDGEEEEREGAIRVQRAIVRAGVGSPGDGRAAIWVFVYVADLDEMLTVAVAADGVVHSSVGHHDDEESDFGDNEPLGEWKLDSDDAAQAANDGDETYARLAGARNVTAVSVLLQGNGTPFWLLALDPEDQSQDGVILTVDAFNGTVTSLSEFFQDFFGSLVRESGRQTGDFTAAVGVTQQASFTLNMDSHQDLVVQLDLTPPSPVPVQARMVMPDGEERTWMVGLPEEPGATASGFVTVEDPLDGTYVVTLTASLVARSDWTVSWCTDGFAFPFTDIGPLGQPACDNLP